MSLALDRQRCPCMDYLVFRLAPFPQEHDTILRSLRDTLASWATSVSLSQRYLYFQPWSRSDFHREGFIDLLYAIGPVVEAALCSRKETSGDRDHETRDEVDPCRATLWITDLGDRFEWEAWWRARIGECFPTFAQWNHLRACPLDACECLTSFITTTYRLLK